MPLWNTQTVESWAFSTRGFGGNSKKNKRSTQGPTPRCNPRPPLVSPRHASNPRPPLSHPHTHHGSCRPCQADIEGTGILEEGVVMDVLSQLGALAPAHLSLSAAHVSIARAAVDSDADGNVEWGELVSGKRGGGGARRGADPQPIYFEPHMPVGTSVSNPGVSMTATSLAAGNSLSPAARCASRRRTAWPFWVDIGRKQANSGEQRPPPC